MTDTPAGWTISSYIAHNEALRHAEERFQAERDRRYREVNEEREKALKIKERADEKALSLASEIQSYKDEKANELRSQIERERGSYATQADLRGVSKELQAVIKPLADYVTAQSGPRAITSQQIMSILIAVSIVVGLYVAFR